MDLSLDDIIKKKRFNGSPSKKFVAKKNLVLRKTLNKPAFRETHRIADARLKIIQKNRAKIVDARDKLVELTRPSGDARRLLDKQKNITLHRNRDVRPGRPPGRLLNTAFKMKPRQFAYTNGMRPGAARLPEAIDIPRGYVDYDNMERMEEEEYAAASRLSRTVKNDISPYDPYKRSDMITPPPPRRMNSWNSASEHMDPFDVYEVPVLRHERRMSTDMSPPKGILRPSTHQLVASDPYERRSYMSQNPSHLSYEMRSRLEHAPDPHASMGIFSNPLKAQQSSGNGHRIVVSNLHTSVTQSDIQELFEDIGTLYDSRIVRPGVAEVIFKSLTDAEKAVETYHNRKLDGQPMKCLLVNPRASNKPTAPAIKTLNSSSNYASSNVPVEIDIDALHKVLFQRH